MNSVLKATYWFQNPNCYAIIQHDEKEYKIPHEQLCRLLLAILDRPKAYDPVSNQHAAILQKIIRPKKKFLEQEAGIFWNVCHIRNFIILLQSCVLTSL